MKTKLLTVQNVIFLMFAIGMSFALSDNAFAEFSKTPDTALTITNKLLSGSGEVRIANTSDEKIFVAWQQWEQIGGKNTATVRLQLLDKKGNNLWEQGGILISDKPTNDAVFRNDLNLLVTSKNEAIITVADFRTYNDVQNPAKSSRDITLYKIDAAKKFIWGANGVTVYSNETNSPISGPSVAIDDNDEVIVAVPIFNAVHINVIRENGTKKLANDILVDGVKDLIVEKAKNGLFYAVYKVNNNSLHVDLYNPALTDQKFVWKGRRVGNDETGENLTPNDEHFVISDGEIGIFIIWEKSKLYIQRIDTSGDRFFKSSGLLLSPNAETIDNPVFSIDTINKIVNIAWYNQFASNYSLLFQKVNFDGEILLNDGGKEPVTDVNVKPVVLLTSPDGRCLMVLSKNNLIEGDELYFANLSLTGENILNSIIPVFLGDGNHNSDKTSIVSTNFFNGQMVIAWYDDNNAMNTPIRHSVKAQSITYNGHLGSGIKESKFQNENIAVCPNPVTNLFNIKYNSKNDQNTLISIYNMQGKLCYRFDYELTQGENYILVNCNLEKGMYIVKLNLKNEDVYTNFIIE